MGEAVHPLAAWARVDTAHGLGQAVFATEPDRHVLTAHEVVAGEERYSCRFTVRTDRDWRTREGWVEVVDATGARSLRFSVDSASGWMVDGRPIPELRGCVDVDVAATPATNTLPIRRLDLGVGVSRRIDVLWIGVPGLDVHRMTQHYTRLSPVDGLDRYEYGDVTYGTFLLTVDGDGVVVDYESFARRV